jgi:CheY-like chemotaxis protein
MSHKILVVDDDLDLRELMVRALKAEKYEIYEAGDGKQALELLLGLPPEGLPSCIILDLMMPVMDGETFLIEIEQKYKTQLGAIKIIVATAKGSPVKPALLPARVERLQKPMDLDELYRVVGKCCE